MLLNFYGGNKLDQKNILCEYRFSLVFFIRPIYMETFAFVYLIIFATASLASLAGFVKEFILTP